MIARTALRSFNEAKLQEELAVASFGPVVTALQLVGFLPAVNRIRSPRPTRVAIAQRVSGEPMILSGGPGPDQYHLTEPTGLFGTDMVLPGLTTEFVGTWPGRAVLTSIADATRAVAIALEAFGTLRHETWTLTTYADPGVLLIGTTRALTGPEDAELDTLLTAHSEAALTAEQTRQIQDDADLDALLAGRPAFIAHMQNWDSYTQAQVKDAAKECFILLGRAMRILLRRERGAAI